MGDVLELAAAISAHVPVVVMCYANPILARGLEQFADALVEVGASGVIVPDLPLEEAPAALAACDSRGLALVPLVAPTTPDPRLAEIGARARGFLYTVAVTGTTGERASLRRVGTSSPGHAQHRSAGRGRVRDRHAGAGGRERRRRCGRGDRRQQARSSRWRGWRPCGGCAELVAAFSVALQCVPLG